MTEAGRCLTRESESELRGVILISFFSSLNHATILNLGAGERAGKMSLIVFQHFLEEDSDMHKQKMGNGNFLEFESRYLQFRLSVLSKKNLLIMFDLISSTYSAEVYLYQTCMH